MIDTSFDIEPPTITSVIKEWVQFPLGGLKSTAYWALFKKNNKQRLYVCLDDITCRYQGNKKSGIIAQ